MIFFCVFHRPVGFAAAISTISNNTPTISVSEEERQRILEEENLRLQQLKVDNSGWSLVLSRRLLFLLAARKCLCLLSFIFDSLLIFVLHALHFVKH
jgi:hypothetical protein